MDLLTWNREVQLKIQDKRKEKPSDEMDTDFLDVDKLLSRYCEEFHNRKRFLQYNLSKKFEIEVRKISYDQDKVIGF